MKTKVKRNKKRRLIKKYGLRCWWCDKRLRKETATIEHLLPLFDGGTHAFDNLRIACYPCNHGRSYPTRAMNLYYQALMENTEAIRQTLQDFRRDALTRFMTDFIRLLGQEGFSYEDLLNAITNWTQEQPDMRQVVSHLEQACTEVQDIQRVNS